MGKEYTREILVLGQVPHLGPVALYDDIEDYLKWIKANGVGDSVLEKSQTLVYNGDYGLHIKSRTTAAAEDDFVSGYRLLYQRPGRRYRFECLFVPDAIAAVKLIYFKLLISDGVLQHQVFVSMDRASGKWTYKSSGGGTADFPGGDQALVADSYHRVLFEWDESKKQITRLVCDGLELSGLELDYYTTASAAAVSMRVDVGLQAGASPPGEIYVDDVLVLEI